MVVPDESEGRTAAERLAELACDHGLTVAVAESLTCGALASRMGQAPSSSDWFAGGVVAYATGVKVEVLGTGGGDVVTRETAEQMARGARADCHEFPGDPGDVVQAATARAVVAALEEARALTARA